MNNQNKIAAIGDKDSILAFKAVGVDIFIADTSIEADTQIKTLAKEQYGVILITESLASQIPSTIQTLKTRTYPVVLLFPSASGQNAGYALESLKTDIEKAVGSSSMHNS